MKKSILFVSLVTLMASHLGAQITINKSHMSSSGQMTILSYDYNGHPFLGNGTNYTWDFTNLIEDERDTVHFGLPQWYPGANIFPTSNLVSINSSIDSSYDFLSLTDNELTFEGTYDITDGISTISPFKMKYITFPSTYNTTFTDASNIGNQKNEVGVDPDGSGPLPLIDSIGFDVTINNTSVIDGYGTVKIPLGTYPAIRQKMTSITDLTNFKMYANGAWSTIPKIYLVLLGMGNTADTSYRVAFWTNDKTIGQPLVTYTYGNRDTAMNDITWVAAKSQASKVNTITNQTMISAFPNPCQNTFQVQVTNAANVELKIYDSEGKFISQYSVKNGDQIDITKFENGVYILRFNDLKTGTNLGNQKITKF